MADHGPANARRRPRGHRARRVLRRWRRFRRYAGRWRDDPARTIAQLRASRRWLHTHPAPRNQREARALVETAEQMVHLGLHDLARRLLHLSVAPESQRMIVMARRRLQISAPVDRALVDTAFERAGADPLAGRMEQVIVGGQGSDVESVARYRNTHGQSIIRKTLIGVLPREVAAYSSGLLDGGERYRSPVLIHQAADRTDRWHLFLEDLGRLHPLSTPEAYVTAARALGELNGRWLGHDDRLAREHPWLLNRDAWDLRVIGRCGTAARS